MRGVTFQPGLAIRGKTMKRFPLIATLAIVALIIPQPSQGASKAKAGAKCLKANSTQINSGKKFTCIRSGSKLIWNKGIDVLGRESNLPSSATSPQDKAPTAGDPAIRKTNCGIGDWYYKTVDGKQNRSFYPDKGFVNSDSRPEKAFHPIRVKAFNLIQGKLNSSPDNNIKTFTLVSNTFPEELLKELDIQLKRNLRYFQNYTPPGVEVRATYFTGRDTDFGNNSMGTMSGPLEDFFMLKLNEQKTFNCSLDGGVSGAHLIYKGEHQGDSGYWLAANTPPQRTIWAPFYQPHELTHSVQAWKIQDIFAIPMPMNFHEGGAEFFGIVLGYSQLGWYSDEMDKKLIEKDIHEKIMDIKSLDDVIQMLTITEVNIGPVAGGNAVPNATRWAYSMGALLWEWVTAEYGADSYWNLLSSMDKTRSYEKSILETFGVSKDDLYRKAAPYILEQIQRALSSKWRDAWIPK